MRAVRHDGGSGFAQARTISVLLLEDDDVDAKLIALQAAGFRMIDMRVLRARSTAEAREHVKGICKKYGAAHFQIGRAYTAYRESRDEAFKDVLDAVKAVVDPRGVFNPGCLGFPIREGRN